MEAGHRRPLRTTREAVEPGADRCGSSPSVRRRSLHALPSSQPRPRFATAPSHRTSQRMRTEGEKRGSAPRDVLACRRRGVPAGAPAKSSTETAMPTPGARRRLGPSEPVAEADAHRRSTPISSGKTSPRPVVQVNGPRAPTPCARLSTAPPLPPDRSQIRPIVHSSQPRTDRNIPRELPAPTRMPESIRRHACCFHHLRTCSPRKSELAHSREGSPESRCLESPSPSPRRVLSRSSTLSSGQWRVPTASSADGNSMEISGLARERSHRFT